MKTVLIILLLSFSFNSYSQGLKDQDNIIFLEPKQSLNDQLIDFIDEIVFVELWSVTCSPCIKQFKYIKELDQYFKNKNIKTISICVSPDYLKKDWENLVHNHKLHGYHIFIPSSKIRQYKQGFNMNKKDLVPLGGNFPYYAILKHGGEAFRIKLLPSDKENFINLINEKLK